MYKFTGYTIKVGGDSTNIFAKSKSAVIEIANQNNLQTYDIIQLFRFEQQAYVEPKINTEENNETNSQIGI